MNTVASTVSKHMGNAVKLSEIWGGIIYNVKAYGAKGDGKTDDTNEINKAIQDAQAAGGGIVYFPNGIYCISSELYANKIPVSLVGAGSGWGAWINAVETNISVLKWIGGSGNMIHFKTVNNSFKIDSIKLDCNQKADVGLLLDGVQGGMIDNVSILNGMSDCGLRLTSTEMTCSWNSFRNLGIQNLTKDNTKAIHLTGDYGNTCHNSFFNTRIDHGGTNSHAIYLGNCDNNAFYDTYIFRNPGANGRGVFCDSSEYVGFPIANAFYHLQSGEGGWWQDAQTQFNVIHFYATDNGQPPPETNGGSLSWTDMAGAMHPIISLNGRYAKPGNNLGGETLLPAGSTSVIASFTTGNEPDASYAAFLSPSNLTGQPWYSNQTTSGFTINVPSALAYDVWISWIIVRL